MSNNALDRVWLIGAGNLCAEDAGENSITFIDNGIQPKAVTVIKKNVETGKYEVIAFAELKDNEFHIHAEPESKIITKLLVKNRVSPERIKYS